MIGTQGSSLTGIFGTGSIFSGPVIQVSGQATDSVVLIGFSITGGRGGPAAGVNIDGVTLEMIDCQVFANDGGQSTGTPANTGGIRINNAFVTLNSCRVVGNRGGAGDSVSGSLPGNSGAPGGILAEGVGALAVNDCLFDGNIGGSGSLGGIICGGPGGCVPLPSGSGGAGAIEARGLSGSVDIRRSRIRGNIAGAAFALPINTGPGGLGVGSQLTMENCEVVENMGFGSGPGGIAVSAFNPPTGLGVLISYCTIANNSGDGLLFQSNAANPLEFVGSIVWGNGQGLVNLGTTPVTVTSSNVQGGVLPGAGNISTDPLFLSPSNADYHLSAGSPCIDAALVTTPPAPLIDRDGDLRPVGASADMGSDEATLFLSVIQSGPGAPITLVHENLQPGSEIYTVFTFDLCAPSAAPNFFGLCLNGPASIQAIAQQIALPLGAAPFHFSAPGTSASFGPLMVPPMTVTALTADVTNGLISRPVRLTVQ